jgi:RNA polymerase sigma-70 factor, ECF subfamily
VTSEEATITADSEISLLRLAQAGDNLAFDDLQRLIAPDLGRFCRRYVQDAVLVEDIVQDVFLRFFRHLPQMDPERSPRPYLYRMARNRCYDELRGWQRHEEAESLDDEVVALRVAALGSDDGQGPEDLVDWMLLKLEVDEAMAAIPFDQRQALLLYAEEGLTYSEVAEVLGVSLGTVKSRIYHAKKKLRQHLHPDTLFALDEMFG